jgi:oxalate decarboxylase/phosphoglucose isomerase-like protein (cupin superfamily)
MDQDLIAMAARTSQAFNDKLTPPWNEIFNVVFFPDRVYHAQYLNATRCPRYRYNVTEVRGKADMLVMKGEVYYDGLWISDFVRIEYRASRLSEVVRERGRFIRGEVIADITVFPDDPKTQARARVKMRFCPWINAYQVEIWEHLEPPVGKRHDYQILDMMGAGGSITHVPSFAKALLDLKALRELEIWFRETDVDAPLGYTITNFAVDDYYNRNIQVPNTQEPSSNANTIGQPRYRINFDRGFYVSKVRDIAPVRYRNGMFEGPPSVHQQEFNDQNVIEMRWVFQQEFAGSNVFFHEVTIPPHTVEGTHQHVGSEELYYCFEGNGFAYVGMNDNPDLAKGGFEIEVRQIFGIGTRECWKVPMQPGSVIFTKSGGIHGIRNDSDAPLRFVAFLYHAS